MLALAGTFQEHIQEAGHAAVNKARVTPRPFIMPSTVIVGPNQPVLLPRASQTIDWELELLIVIGRAGKHISVADAMAHVAGYSIFNDISARARSTSPRGATSAMAMHMAGTPVSTLASVHCAAATENFIALEHHFTDVPF